MSNLHQKSIQAFFDNQIVGMVEVDNQGRYIQANQRWLEMTGYRTEDLREIGFQTLTHPDDLPEQLLLDKDIREGKRTSYRMEKRYIRKDGTIFWADLSVSGVHDDNATLISFLVLIVDITEEREAAENLRQIQELQATLLDASPDIICYKDGDGRWLRANKADLQLFQLEDVDYRGKTDAELAPYSPFYAEAFKACKMTDEKAWQSGKLSIEEEIIPIPDNGEKIYEIVKSPLFYPDGRRKALVVLGRDITQRKKNERKIKESEQRFRNILNQMEHVPVQGYDENRQIIYWNNASTHLYGYSEEEALGRKLEDLIIPEHMRDAVIQSTQLWVNDNQKIPADKLILCDKDGNDVPVYSSHLMHTTETGEKELFCVDIGLRLIRQAEEQIQQLAAAVEQSGETIVITDTDGTIEYVNPMFTAITGYNREEAIGQNPRILNSGKTDPAVFRDLWQTVTQKKTWKGRFINKKKSGELFTENVTISPILNSAGTTTNYVAVKRDITEQLLTEEKYQQAQKMEAVGQLAGGVAHDFNNMLAIILGQVEIALMKIPPGDPLEKRLQEIKSAANRSSTLTQQLLGFARKQSRQPQVLNLSDTVATMLAILKRLIGENLELRWLAEAENPLVDIDPGHFNQILTNLIINARDSIYGTGVITVKAKETILTNKFCSEHPGSTPGYYIQLSISDTGCGMGDDVLQKIFDPFFTTKGIGKGTGLGLSMVFGLVKQNNGYIDVISKPEEGSTFNLYFPQVQLEKKQILQFNDKGLVHGNETILVVEDERSLLDITITMLTTAGYSVLSAQGPFAGIQLAEKHKGPIHLLLTDIVMPKMNGVELGENLLKIKPEIKVLYMSGYPKEHFSQLKLHNMSVQLLKKPFSTYQLTKMVREALDAS